MRDSTFGRPRLARVLGILFGHPLRNLWWRLSTQQEENMGHRLSRQGAHELGASHQSEVPSTQLSIAQTHDFVLRVGRSMVELIRELMRRYLGDNASG